MTLRGKIADWISGGALTRAQSNAVAWFGCWQDAVKRRVDADNGEQFAHNDATNLRDALTRIAACETPSANGTVRRMARIAREAME